MLRLATNVLLRASLEMMTQAVYAAQDVKIPTLSAVFPIVIEMLRNYGGIP